MIEIKHGDCLEVMRSGLGCHEILNLYAEAIALPPLDAQRAIVAEIDAEQALVDANRDLMARMEKKIQATLARVWGEKTGIEKEAEYCAIARERTAAAVKCYEKKTSDNTEK